ncbi:MAG: nucleotidyl transferase AbiEii/AbiGii toxin family protein [Flavobacterium sp.]|jgi:predicted nucleotidyltransferase component of viral defense system|uniref:nucleotidyl transferase AbiEii/AbiGii toxin family protein n=1 Tax=Flavobacterium sp. TaxID=239 RepID=UPI0022C70C68|nr:nucleotidyl transferase AbiEii/AbiGii toxin family protein [Flavobacterium sp.]MCZ8168254.1 nucleotidyl transferase AbiEii/AbiGii toxin family protein [Flavobacterium sp.]MCZ8295993.1 nucleotidyl transferase AbiEii/AbiGii toxin family protein [Flavobacterium sp.]
MLDIIKRLTIKALLHDEQLMYGLVLKGGNALQLVYEITDRASMDIDFSIEGDFSERDFQRISGILDVLLNEQFQTEKLVVFDIRFVERPKTNKEKVWKGYNIEFKVTREKDWYPDDIEKSRREAIKIADQSTKFSVDISSFEYISSAKKVDLDGTVLLVYTPEMIVIEKLRALCQSIPEYKAVIPSAKVKGRARDFYDIWNICSQYPIDFSLEENVVLLHEIFRAKKVPFEFLDLLPIYKDLQKENWNSVEDTLSTTNEGFDFYFDYTLALIEKIKNL